MAQYLGDVIVFLCSVTWWKIINVAFVAERKASMSLWFVVFDFLHLVWQLWTEVKLWRVQWRWPIRAQCAIQTRKGLQPTERLQISLEERTSILPSPWHPGALCVCWHACVSVCTCMFKAACCVGDRNPLFLAQSEQKKLLPWRYANCDLWQQNGLRSGCMARKQNQCPHAQRMHAKHLVTDSKYQNTDRTSTSKYQEKNMDAHKLAYNYSKRRMWPLPPEVNVSTMIVFLLRNVIYDYGCLLTILDTDTLIYVNWSHIYRENDK